MVLLHECMDNVGGVLTSNVFYDDYDEVDLPAIPTGHLEVYSSKSDHDIVLLSPFFLSTSTSTSVLHPPRQHKKVQGQICHLKLHFSVVSIGSPRPSYCSTREEIALSLAK